ncbi:MAG: ribosome-binding factor A [Alphaproteobacteria bacterium]|nr:ribosome-binding factor A [Alphaproteobacteria bacterium]
MSTLDLFIPSKAPSFRQEKMAQTIRQILSTLCIHADYPPVEDEEGNTIVLKESVSVTRVEISPDLQHATAHFMTLGGQNLDFTQTYLNALNGYFRHMVGKKLVSKYTPEIKFAIDTTFEATDTINRLLKNNAS